MRINIERLPFQVRGGNQGVWHCLQDPWYFKERHHTSLDLYPGKYKSDWISSLPYQLILSLSQTSPWYNFPSSPFISCQLFFVQVAPLWISTQIIVPHHNFAPFPKIRILSPETNPIPPSPEINIIPINYSKHDELTKSTPIVEMYDSVYVSSANLKRRLDLPTPESPIRSSLKR